MHFSDPNEPPLFECSLSCDNLLCDALGRAPSAKLVVSARLRPDVNSWTRIGQTEVVEKSSNPAYMRTLPFRASDGICADRTRIRVVAYDFRERLTATRTMLGKADVDVREMLEAGEIVK